MRIPILAVLLSLPVSGFANPVAPAKSRADQTSAAMGKRGFTRGMRLAVHGDLLTAEESQGRWHNNWTPPQRGLGYISSGQSGTVRGAEGANAIARTRSHLEVIRDQYKLDKTNITTKNRTTLVTDAKGEVVGATHVSREEQVDFKDGYSKTTLTTTAKTERVDTRLGGLLKIRTATETTRTVGPRKEREEDKQSSAHLIIGKREFKLPAGIALRLASAPRE